MNSGCCHHQQPADIDDNASTGAPSTTAGGSTAGLLSSDDLASSHSSYEYSTHHLGRSSPTVSLASDSDLLRRQSAGFQQQSAAMGLNNNGSNGSPGPMVPVNVEELLRTGNDKRTTVMIKRIPRRYTVAMLRDEIDRRCPALRNGGYDLLYLPVDTAKVANRGYAFINFRSPKHVLVFASAFQNYEWPGQRA
ncbi:hypothetical protein FOZ62_016272, partial [Perkinsus olseni]